MLAKYWRLRFYWVADNTLTYADGARVNVRLSPWKLVSGELTIDTTITSDMGFSSGTIVTTGQTESAVFDNTTNLYWGAHGYLEVIADLTSTDGTGYLYMEQSDDNTNWPSDTTNFDITKHCGGPIAIIEKATTSTDQSTGTNFEMLA